jgi:S1-C subfamily serine protease
MAAGRQSGSLFLVILRFLLLCVVIVVLLRLWEGRPWFRARAPAAEPRTVTPRGDLTGAEQGTIALFESASPSVVHITTVAMRRDMFSLNVFEIPQGTGSGFIWDADGHVVTNFHVLQGAHAARVTLADHSTWDARLVGAEPDKDLAVLQIAAPAERLRPLPVGTSADLRVGQTVFAIGNPFGLDQTLTSGIISGLGREIRAVTGRTIQDVIQTDAAINPGNSGGPLLDSAGRLIGVNTAIFSPSATYIGIGFAVPVDTVNRIVPQLVRYGRTKRAGFGITVASDYVLQRLGEKGALVLGVPPGSAAAEAGFKPTVRDANGRITFGDIIVAIDGKPVNGTSDLLDLLDPHEPGDTVTVTVKRDGRTLELQAALQILDQ